MEEAPPRIPDIVIDGRQAYQHYGPWSWLAGSYPHPTSTTSSPRASCRFPISISIASPRTAALHRVSVPRLRFRAERDRAGLHHPPDASQRRQRPDAGGRTEDRGTVLCRFGPATGTTSDGATRCCRRSRRAGGTTCINMIPARDSEEDRRFSEDDRDWFRTGSTGRRRTRNTCGTRGPFSAARPSATSTVRRRSCSNRGFIFLFNPNGRRLSAEFTLDDTIGLGARGAFVLRSCFRCRDGWSESRTSASGRPATACRSRIDGGSAMVLEIQPGRRPPDPVLFNAPGTATMDGEALAIAGARGEVGSRPTCSFSCQQGVRRRGDCQWPAGGYRIESADGVTVRAEFDGALFRHYQPVADVPRGFTGGRVAGAFTIPRRIVEQLAARRKAWPIPWTPEDFRATWLGPGAPVAVRSDRGA